MIFKLSIFMLLVAPITVLKASPLLSYALLSYLATDLEMNEEKLSRRGMVMFIFVVCRDLLHLF